MVGGAIGIFFFIKAFVHAPPHLKEEPEPAAPAAASTPGDHGAGKGAGEKPAAKPPEPAH